MQRGPWHWVSNTSLPMLVIFGDSVLNLGVDFGENLGEEERDLDLGEEERDLDFIDRTFDLDDLVIY